MTPPFDEFRPAFRDEKRGLPARQDDDLPHSVSRNIDAVDSVGELTKKAYVHHVNKGSKMNAKGPSSRLLIRRTPAICPSHPRGALTSS